jgi:hypothetical protein
MVLLLYPVLVLRSVLRPSGFICEKTSILGVYILLHTEDDNGLYIRCIEFNYNYSALYLYGIGSYMQEFVNKGQQFKH